MYNIYNSLYRVNNIKASPSIKGVNFTGTDNTNKNGYVLPEIKSQIINDTGSDELNALKLSLCDRMRYSKLGIKDKYFQEEAKRLEHIFEKNSQMAVIKQYEQILLDVTEIAKQTLSEHKPMETLTNKPINKSASGYYVYDGFTKSSVYFYQRIKLTDGTVLSLNNIKAGCQGFAHKLKNCPEYVLSIIDTKGQHTFIHGNSAGNISLISGLIDYMARIGKNTVKKLT